MTRVADAAERGGEPGGVSAQGPAAAFAEEVDAEEQGQGDGGGEQEGEGGPAEGGAVSRASRRPRDAASSARMAAIRLRIVSMDALPRSVLTTAMAASKPLSLRSRIVCASSASLASAAAASACTCSCRRASRPGERSEAIDGGGDDGMGSRVGVEVSLVASEEIAALAGLGVRDVEEHVVEPARMSWLAATAAQEFEI